MEEGIPIDTYPFYNSYGSSSAPAFSNSHSSQYDGDFYSGSSYRNYNDDRYYYEGEISPEYDSRIPARTHRMPAPYMDQDVYPMPSYGAEMVSRAPPVAMESRRLSPSVPRPKKEAKEERRERKESGVRSKSKRSAKGQRSPSEAERQGPAVAERGGARGGAQQHGGHLAGDRGEPREAAAPGDPPDGLSVASDAGREA